MVSFWQNLNFHFSWPRLYLFLGLFLLLGSFLFLLGESFWASNELDGESWNFIFQKNLLVLVKNTLLLMFLTFVMSSLIGFAQALLMVYVKIKGKAVLHILFILPMAFPLYVLSFIYVGALEYSGFLATFLRDYWEASSFYFAYLKHPVTIAFVFSLALSPYVYLFQKSFLERFDQRSLQIARTLGQGPWGILRKVIIPCSRGWIFSSGIFVCLEVLCDFGGVSVFNYETFSTAIYESWIGFFSFKTAFKLGLFPLLGAVFLFVLNSQFKVLFVERENRSLKPLFFPGSWGQGLIWLLVLGYGLLSFFFPLVQLFVWGLSSSGEGGGGSFLAFIGDTLTLGLLCSLFIAFFALKGVYFYRFYWNLREKFLSLFLKVGYALPGTLVGVSVMAILSLAQIHFFGFWAYGALFIGLLVRFYGVAFELQNKACELVRKQYDWIGQSLGKTPRQTFFRTHLPLLRPALVSSVLLVFLEVIKEMPITLILRPYGVNTLATKIYELTSEGEWVRSSRYALTLVVFGGLFVLLSEFWRKRGSL